MYISLKNGSGVNTLSGQIAVCFLPVMRALIGTRHVMESGRDNALKREAQRFISRDFDGLVTMAAERHLPPGQREVRKWPRLDLGLVPRFDPKEWDLRGDGSGGKT